MPSATARWATIRLATDPSRVKLPAKVEAMATTSQARCERDQAGDRQGVRLRRGSGGLQAHGFAVSRGSVVLSFWAAAQERRRRQFASIQKDSGFTQGRAR